MPPALLRGIVANIIEGFIDQLVVLLSQAPANQNDVNRRQDNGGGSQKDTNRPVDCEPPSSEVTLKKGPTPGEHGRGDRQAKHPKPSSQGISGILHPAI